MKQAGGESASREPPEVGPEQRPEVEVFQLSWLGGANQQAAREALVSLAELSYRKRPCLGARSRKWWPPKEEEAEEASSHNDASNSNSPARPAIQVYWRTCSGSKGCGRLRYAGPGRYTLCFAGHLVATIGFRDGAPSAVASLELIEGSAVADGAEWETRREASGLSLVELPLVRFQGRRRKRLKLRPAAAAPTTEPPPQKHIQACVAAAICLAADHRPQYTAGSGGSSSDTCQLAAAVGWGNLSSCSSISSSSSISISSSSRSGNSNSCCCCRGCCSCRHCHSDEDEAGPQPSTSASSSCSDSMSHSTSSSSSSSTATDSSTAGVASCQYEACQWRARLSLALEPHSAASHQQEPALLPAAESAAASVVQLEGAHKEAPRNMDRPRIWCVQGPSLELADNSSPQQPTINGVGGEQAPLSQLLTQQQQKQAAAPLGASSSNLLNPMDMLWCGGGGGLSDMRALSCTEASWAGGEKAGALAAQLAAACARSKSLGGAEPASRQLKERLARHANQVAGNPLRFLQRVGKLTIGALTYIRLSSGTNQTTTTTTPPPRQRQASCSSKQRPQQMSSAGPARTGNGALLGRRSLSQRTLAHRARSSATPSGREPAMEPELVVPHQLAKFASASNLVSVSAEAGQASAGGQQATYDERLLYSREGVYMGPGALYSWRQSRAPSAAAAANPSSGGAPLAAGKEDAHALAFGQAGQARRQTTDPSSSTSHLANQPSDIESRSAHHSAPSARPDLPPFHASSSQATSHAQDTKEPLPVNMHQPPAASGSALHHQKQQQSKQAPHRAMWLTNFTHRVHAHQRDPSNRKSLLHDHQQNNNSKPPKLSRETRSNSLTGPLSQHGAHTTTAHLHQRHAELSKSSLELVQPSTAASGGQLAGCSAELSQARRHLETLLLEGAGPGNQNQQHQLLLDAARCGSNNEPARTYGINLISSCVHCQLVAELACHHEPSAYLEQLLPDQLRARNRADGARASSRGPIYPSVVLTVCSKQTTLDEALGGDQEEKQPEEETHNSTSSSSVVSFEEDFEADEIEEDEEEEELEVEEEVEVDYEPEEEEEEESSRCTTNEPRWSSLNSLDSSDSLDSSSRRDSSGSSNGAAGELSDPEEQRRNVPTRRHSTRRSRKSGSHKRRGPSRKRAATRRVAGKTPNQQVQDNKHKVGLARAAGPSIGERQQQQQQQTGAPSILLKVPSQGTSKQARSASLDAPYLLKVPPGGPSGGGVGGGGSPEGNHSLVPESSGGHPVPENIFDCSLAASKSSRSRSVDIALPAGPGDSYQLVGAAGGTSPAPLGFQTTLRAARELVEGRPERQAEARSNAGSSTIHLLAGYQKKKFIQGEIKIACANGETRALKLFVDWHAECINGEHLWTYAGSSSDACYVGESECLKHGARLSCSACKIMAHTGCISILIDKIKFICKHTYKDLTVNNPRHLKEFQQENVIYHHWIHKRTLCGRCKQCSKTFGNTKLSFSSKEIQAITCSWCKVSYHNKENCYTLASLTEPCTLGVHRESIIPPTWIVKLSTSNTYQQQQFAGPDQSANQTTLCNSPIEDSLMTTTTTKDSNETLRIAHHSDNLVDSMRQNENLNPSSSIGKPQVSHHSADIVGIANNNKNNTTSCAITDNNCLRQNISDPIDSLSNTTGDSLMTHTEDSNQIPTRHPQESTNQYQKHQLKQYYKQLDVGVEQMTNQTKFGDCNTELKTNDLHHKQHHHHSTTDYSENSSDFYRNFKIIPQPIHGAPNAGSKPVLVFVNPRSGGNQGAKMMHKFNWLLNPRQVFDLIHSGGPKAALNLYRDVPNLRILTIGGDGTASWILSYLDEVGVPNKIPVAVLPLGTGNDLARALGWGGGYTDEPIAKILAQVRDGEIVQLDRWNIQVERNPEATPSSPNEFSSSCYASSTLELNSPSITSSQSYFGLMSQNVNNNNINTASTLSIIDQTNCDTSMLHGTNTNAFSIHHDEQGVDRLPMDVINNYFSFGVDAHIALEFHLAREAHPERFNSRLRNKMFYGQAGGKDLLKRKWKDLSNFVTLYCDGQDITSRLKELKVHSVLFLNIPSYGGGTRPWPTTTTSAFTKPRTDDGLIEVIGLTTYQLPLLQAGGHGTCIAQCKRAKIITSRTIPMQVDGEPCKLLPSILNISFKNQVCMLAKSKNSSKIDPDISEV